MKLTKLEKNWIFYDVGNSAFIMIATTIIPIVFNSLAKADLDSTQYLAYWGYAVSASTLITAIIGPILGAYADRHKKRKSLFTSFMLLGVVGCVLLPAWSSWIMFLVGYVIAKVGFNLSLVFYDSMLTDITSEDRMDNVSSHGYAWGYIGSVVPFIISILIMTKNEALGISMTTASWITFILNGLWWYGWTIPLLRSYRQKYTSTKEATGLRVFSHMKTTLAEIKTQPKIYMFLVAFFFYIDGVYTIINMATAYGTSLGLSQTGLVLALLVTQFVAFPFALAFGRLSSKYPTDKLLKITIGAYALIALYAVQLDKLYEFWILAIAVGAFQGAIQALSRSYYAKIIPPEKSGEYFGIYDIFGKGASLFGTLIVSMLTQITSNQNLAILALVVMFLIGYYLFDKTNRIEDKKESI